MAARSVRTQARIPARIFFSVGLLALIGLAAFRFVLPALPAALVTISDEAAIAGWRA